MWMIRALILSLPVMQALCDPCEKRLLDYLFNSSHYDVDMRPVQNHSHPLTVSMDASLFQIQQLFWQNDDFVWSADDFCGMTEITVAASRVWKPQIILYNSVSQEKTGSNVLVPTSVRVFHDGHHLWLTLSIMSASCRVQAQNFPYDTQICLLMFGSMTENVSKLTLISDQGVMDTSAYQPNGEWQMIKTHVSQGSIEGIQDNFTQITYHVVLSRHPLFYVINLVLPCVLLLLVSLLAFCLHPQSNNKISLTTTLLLTMMFFQVMMSDHLPPTSDAVPRLTIFFTVSHVLLVLSTGACVYVLSLCDKGQNVATPMPKVYKSILNCQCLRRLTRLQDQMIETVNRLPQMNSSHSLFTEAIWNTRKDLAKPNNFPGLSYIATYALFKKKYGSSQGRNESAKREWYLLALMVNRLFLITFSVLTFSVLFTYVVLTYSSTTEVIFE